MIYLLDTDVLIFIIRGLKAARRPAEKRKALSLTERCIQAQTDCNSVGLSALTVSELEFGAHKSGRYEMEIAAVNKVLVPFDIYDYDAVSCPSQYGRIRHNLENNGIGIGAMDLLIAAHALALDAILVSNNVSHFARVDGLKTVAW